MDSCHHCPKRASCREICPEVEAQLPKPWSGAFRVGRNGDAQADMLRVLERRIFVRAVLDHRDCLTRRQRVVFDCYYNDGMSHSEIAAHLGITRNAASETLARARERIDQAMLDALHQHEGEGDAH